MDKFKKNGKRDNLDAKYKLKNGTLTSIRTTMIGALAIFEEFFADEIAQDPERWEAVRTEILNRGHECMDIASNHFNKFNITYKDISFTFKDKYRDK